jgi:glycerophosphoryl diester phosphodiesterase
VIGFAHRGASAHAPENTLEAFELALAMGATGLESDVWVTRDGVPVLDHDGELPVGGTRRRIPELARAELPPHVPTLAELYERCGTDVPLSLDVKDEAAAAPTLAVARAAGAEARLWLCHWSWRVVADWRPLSAEVVLVDSTRVRHMRTPPAERAARMARLGIDAINLPARDWTAARVAPFRAHGRRVLGWDAQDVETLRRLADLGLDGVYSDHVDRMMAVLGRLGPGPGTEPGAPVSGRARATPYSGRAAARRPPGSRAPR